MSGLTGRRCLRPPGPPAAGLCPDNKKKGISMVNKQKILIVDDDSNIAELISLYLTKECFDTMIVGDGESALVAVKSFSPPT